MPYCIPDENRPITMAQIKRMLYPSPVPRNPSKDAFIGRGICWYDNAPIPEVGANQTAALINEFVEGAPGRFLRSWTVRDKFADISAARAAKLAEINDWYVDEMNRISAGLPQHEINTFYRQETDAEALTEEPDAAAPFVREQAAHRGISVAELSERIKAKAAIFTSLSAMALGNKQRLEDEVESAQTVESVAEIIIDYQG